MLRSILTYQLQGAIIDKLTQPCRTFHSILWQPRPHQRYSIAACQEVCREPRQRIIKSLADFQPFFGIPHLHTLLMHSQSVDAFLRERHEQKVKSYACNCIVLCVKSSIATSFRGSVRFSFQLCEARQRRQRLCELCQRDS